MKAIIRKLELGIGVILVVIVCLMGLEKDSKEFQVSLIKAQPEPWKVRATISNRSVRRSSSERSYALNQLSIPYIQDPALRKFARGIYWCGTPTISYLLSNSRPTNSELKKNAVRLAAGLKNIRR
jgi:hypothetical protein